MPYIPLRPSCGGSPLIMVFAEGTIFKPRSFWQLYKLGSYVPVNGCADKLREWAAQGAEIVYCTSRRGTRASNMAKLLARYDFPGSGLYYRERGADYARLIGQVRPAVLVEDDCRSIGGAWQMCVTRLPGPLRESLRGIVVREFGGIGHLPSALADLTCPAAK